MVTIKRKRKIFYGDAPRLDFRGHLPVIPMFIGASASVHFCRLTMKLIQIGANGDVHPLEASRRTSDDEDDDDVNPTGFCHFRLNARGGAISNLSGAHL